MVGYLSLQHTNTTHQDSVETKKSDFHKTGYIVYTPNPLFIVFLNETNPNRRECMKYLKWPVFSALSRSPTFCGRFSPFAKLTFTTWRHHRNMSEGTWQLWHFAKGTLSWLPSGLFYTASVDTPHWDHRGWWCLCRRWRKALPAKLGPVIGWRVTSPNVKYYKTKTWWCFKTSHKMS